MEEKERKRQHLMRVLNPRNFILGDGVLDFAVNGRHDAWEGRFVALKQYLENQGIRVVFVPHDYYGDFAAMNRETARRFGAPMPGNADIALERGHSWEAQFKNLVHEANELGIELAHPGIKYWRPHMVSLEQEKLIR